METKALARLKRKITVENLWMYIVKTLHDEGDLRAYDLIKRLRERYSIDVATVTAYVVLYKMTREGLIERYSSQDGATIYRVTEKGLEALREAIALLRRLSVELEPSSRDKMESSTQK